jgi:hypothetical protein
MRSTLLLLPVLVLGLSACDEPPVVWNDPIALSSPAGPSRLVFTPAGQPQFVPAVSIAARPPATPGACAASVRTAQGTQRLFAVWWSTRPDSSAVLYSAASADSGRTWALPVAVDTSDVSTRGCNRPPPSITTSGDDMHVAYSMAAPEGTGVFFAHFMDNMLHSPVAVIYGDHLVTTAIAADGDRVAVAYEDPNGKRQQINVAFSRTQGHIFEWRETATRDIDVATSPSVALHGRDIAVAWAAQKFEGGPGSTVVRVGRIK